MEIKFAHHPFLTFADVLVNNPDVQNTLERLHAQYALNGNLILYAVWWGHHQRGRLAKQDYKTLSSIVHNWHERVFLPLQRLMQNIAYQNNPRWASIKKWIVTEINTAVHIERQLIADAFLKLTSHKRNPAQQLSDACHNITNYCQFSRIRIDEEDQVAVSGLLQAAFPNLITAEITEACQNSLNSNTFSMDLTFAQLPLNDF